MTRPIVRFAPSPTGLLHIGNARTALLNALFARREGGTFILRFDDTDIERSKPEFAAAIAEDLAWLGIMPDVVVHQSARVDLYAAVAERLKAIGRLYACYETPDELERRRRLQLGRGLPPIYDRAALALTDEDRAKHDFKDPYHFARGVFGISIYDNIVVIEKRAKGKPFHTRIGRMRRAIEA